MSYIPKDYINSVVSIGVEANGEIKWFATGFFMS